MGVAQFQEHFPFPVMADCAWQYSKCHTGKGDGDGRMDGDAEPNGEQGDGEPCAACAYAAQQRA